MVANVDASDDEVVVRFNGDVVTSKSVSSDEVPENPHLTVGDEDGDLVEIDGDELKAGDEPVTADNNTVRVRSDDPDLVVTTRNVVNDTIVVDDDGNVTTEESEVQLEAGGEPIVYPDYDQYYYSVQDISADDAIGEGEDLELTVELWNTKFADGDEEEVEIQLVDGGSEPTSRNVSLEGGEREDLSFTHETAWGDSDATAVEVDVLENGTTGQQLGLSISEAKVVVDDIDTNTPVAGDDLIISADLVRFGTYPDGDDYIIDFYVDGERAGDTTVSIPPGSEQTVEFPYETSKNDTTLDVAVDTGDHSDSTTASILSQPFLENNLEAMIVDRNWPDEGENLTLTTFVQYQDEDIEPESPQEYPIELYVEGELVDSHTARLEPDDPFDRFELVYETQPGDAPRVDAEVRSPGAGDTAQPRINGSGFEVSIVEIDDPVNESDRLTTIAQIENTGDITDEQDVRLRIDSGYGDPDRTSREVVDNATVELGPGHRTTERFTYRTNADDVPIVEVAIISGDDEALGNATVRAAEPWFDVSETTVEHDEVTDEVTLSAAVNNTGLETDEQYVEFIVDGEVVHIDRVSLGPWEERVLSTTIDAPAPGSYDFSVVTDDVEEVATGAVTVDDPSAGPADDGVDDEIDDTEPPADDDDGLPWYLVALGVLGVLASVFVLVVYRNDPENFPPDAATLQQQARSAAQTASARASVLVAAIKSGDPGAIAAALKRMVGLGAGSLIVQNELPREALVRVRCQTADDTVVLEDLELAPNERRELGSLPDAGEFTVGAGVEDITAHQEAFSSVSGDVGVVLKAEGILIANLG
ncbi:hypothetical protein [Natrarchaeobaculum aegyptiacum]|uniref:hypothetical protein n=1 Tax=Natrarchaeobaculum aegyptiacum TaxID=745377 RepID=UPI00126027AF|nr:hypothetical protein [Natrarchaeobaculum aegyptiacum]